MTRAMRRRHGIPDDDNRPFNVAYAAASQARKGGPSRGKALLQEESAPRGDEAERLAGAGKLRDLSRFRATVTDSSQAPEPVHQVSGLFSGHANVYPVFDRGMGSSQ